MTVLVLALALATAPVRIDGQAWPVQPAWPHRPAAYLEEQPPTTHEPVAMGDPGVIAEGGCSSGYAQSLAEQYAWDVGVAMAVMGRETGGRYCTWMVNPASGTSGLFQLAPFWWNGSSSFGWVFDPLDPVQNVAYAYKIYVYEEGWAPAWCANIAGVYDPPGC